MRVLVIQVWTIDPGPLAASLRGAGIDAAITRVDYEAALNAALVHERFDVAIFDPETPDLSAEQIERCLKLDGRDMPLVILDDVAAIGTQVLRILAPKRS